MYVLPVGHPGDGSYCLSSYGRLPGCRMGGWGGGASHPGSGLVARLWFAGVRCVLSGAQEAARGIREEVSIQPLNFSIFYNHFPLSFGPQNAHLQKEGLFRHNQSLPENRGHLSRSSPPPHLLLCIPTLLSPSVVIFIPRVSHLAPFLSS